MTMKDKIIKELEKWYNSSDTCSGRPHCCIDECDLCFNCYDDLKRILLTILDKEGEDL